MTVIQTENSKKFSKKLELLLDDLDCENLEQLDERIEGLRNNDEIDDINRIAGCLNSMGEGIHFRVDQCEVSDYDRQTNLPRIRVYTYVGINKQYELCLEDDYTGYDYGAEQMIEDTIAYEKEATELFLLFKQK